MKENYSTMNQLVFNLATEASLGEEVASNEPIFTKCERKPQSQLVKVSAMCNCNYIRKYLFSPGHGPVQHRESQSDHLSLSPDLHRAGCSAHYIEVIFT